MEPLWPLLQRHQRRCSEHADLAHAAAEQLPNHAAAFNKIFRPNDHRAHRCAESFAEAELDRVELPGDLGDILTKINCGVKHPCAVEVNFQSCLMSLIADRVGETRRINHAT